MRGLGQCRECLQARSAAAALDQPQPPSITHGQCCRTEQPFGVMDLPSLQNGQKWPYRPLR
jgi:hypothetical protein